MGLLDKLTGKNNEELENLIMQNDYGEIDFDILEQYFIRNKVSEAQYNKARIEGHFKRANQGNAVSQYYYALLIQDRDKQQAVDYYTMSANQGYLPAMEALSLGYSKYANDIGSGFGENPELELQWQTKAAETGNPKSICSLALAYSLGDIVEENNEEAYRLYMQAAEKGYAGGYVGAAHLLINPEDREKSKDLMLKALECTDTDETTFSTAALSLGWYYLPAENKEEYDARLSTYCFSLAYVLGNDACAEKIKETGYKPSKEEWDKWVEDAKCLRFQPY